MTQIIPQPAFFETTNEKFRFTAGAQIVVAPASPVLLRIANGLANHLRTATGFALPVVAASGAETRGNIVLTLGDDTTPGAEGYALRVASDEITLQAHAPAGLFYGAQTLRQLLPDVTGDNTLEITGVQIRDVPRFEWRGSMLDVARHFFTAQDVKRYIDLMAFYKMNVLHLHLTDDQGWRIEIKSWDRLATIGGSSGVDGKNSGYYTQDEYRELVAYAAEQYILIVPEIDTPAHTNAALASYAALNCDDVAPALYTGTEVGFCSLCIDKEITYQFLDDVIRELAALTPGEFIHIGGDEAHSTEKEAYIRFVERAEPIVQKYGKRMIGWEEIAQAKISPQTVVQHWFSDHAALGVKQGARVILSPAHKAYLDMQYDEASPLGLHWAAYIEAQDAYDWDPETLVEGVTRNDILGVEAPLWAETLLTFSDIEYMALPRLTAIAEIGWSPQAQRDWNSYRERVAAHGKRWSRQGMNFYRSPQVAWA